MFAVAVAAQLYRRATFGEIEYAYGVCAGCKVPVFLVARSPFHLLEVRINTFRVIEAYRYAAFVGFGIYIIVAPVAAKAACGIYAVEFHVADIECASHCFLLAFESVVVEPYESVAVAHPDVAAGVDGRRA